MGRAVFYYEGVVDQDFLTGALIERARASERVAARARASRTAMD